MAKKVISWILLIFWMIVIFSFSSQNGGESSGLSNSIVYFMENLLNVTFNREIISFLIRKIAHITEYAILTFLVINLFKQYKILNRENLIIILVLCVFYAITDECHQLFIAGRNGSFRDVLVDSLGIGSVILLYKIIKVK